TAAMPFDFSYAVATPSQSFGVFFNQANVLRSGPRQPGGSLMLFRGAAGAADLIDRSDAAIEAAFLGDLAGLFADTRSVVREVIVQRWTAGAPFRALGAHCCNLRSLVRLGVSFWQATISNSRRWRLQSRPASRLPNESFRGATDDRLD